MVVEGYSMFIPTGDFMVPIPRCHATEKKQDEGRQGSQA